MLELRDLAHLYQCSQVLLMKETQRQREKGFGDPMFSLFTPSKAVLLKNKLLCKTDNFTWNKGSKPVLTPIEIRCCVFFWVAWNKQNANPVPVKQRPRSHPVLADKVFLKIVGLWKNHYVGNAKDEEFKGIPYFPASLPFSNNQGSFLIKKSWAEEITKILRDGVKTQKEIETGRHGR